MTEQTPLDERHPPIKPRRVKFDWSATPLHWIPGDPVATHAINTLHLMLPAGERWFVQVYKDALPYITDEKLREEVKGFMGQEAVHSYSHQHVLSGLLERHGLNHRQVTAFPDWLVRTRPARRARYSPGLRRRSLLYEVALIAAIEHYTAVLGQWILDAEALDRAQADPVMLDLLRWHGAEEVEHRSVAFDVFQQLSRELPHPRRVRIATWAAAITALYLGIFGGTYFLLRKDPTVTARVTVRKMVRGYSKASSKGRVPPWSVFLREAKIYLDPGHHPSQVCSTQRALDYLATSPAVRAAAG